MSIDLTQFHQIFYEESFEGLDSMENCLLELDSNDVNEDTINEIFRAIHSLKGSSGTFGFKDISEFTHVLETLLDENRQGKRQVEQSHIDIYLRSVDCLRTMLLDLQQGVTDNEDNKSVALELRDTFEAILSGETPLTPSAKTDQISDTTVDTETQDASQDKTAADTPSAPSSESLLSCSTSVSEPSSTETEDAISELEPEQKLDSRASEDQKKATVNNHDVEPEDEHDSQDVTDYLIHFRPNRDLFKTGNEPIRIFRELAEMGGIRVKCNPANVPSFSQLIPDECYLSWEIFISTRLPKKDLLGVFEWVMDNAFVKIDTLGGIFDVADPAESDPSVPDEPVTTDSDSNNKNADNNANAGAQRTSLGDATSTTQGATSKSNNANPSSNKPVSKRKAPGTAKDSGSIRVAIDKIDSLVNLVGELVITQSMLGQMGDEDNAFDLVKLQEGLAQLEHNTRELQQNVMSIRMLPISFVFNKFPRMVRDLSRQLGKSIDVVISGESTELDKTVMEKIGDPMVHLVRNAIDHGLETPDVRLASGKPEQGTIQLNSYHQGGSVIIEIKDDGAGLNRDRIREKAIANGLIHESDQLSDAQIDDLIFQPGFSTSDQVTDISGRGVGMDVVRNNITKLNGSVEVRSESGVGSTFTVRLPLTLAILDGQLIRVGQQIFIVPLVNIIESLQTDKTLINYVAGGCDVYRLREEYIPIVRLWDVFGIEPDSKNIENNLLVVVESGLQKIALVVDDLLVQQQVVIKSIEKNYQKTRGISGASILGDGRVSLILDIMDVVDLAGASHALRSTEETESNEGGYAA